MFFCYGENGEMFDIIIVEMHAAVEKKTTETVPHFEDNRWICSQQYIYYYCHSVDFE